MAQTVEQLEARIENLEACYKDVAYDYVTNLIQRIEDIRKDVEKQLNQADGHVRIVADDVRKEVGDLISDGIKSLEDLRSASVASALDKILSEGKHGLVSVPGVPHPVLKRIR